MRTKKEDIALTILSKDDKICVYCKEDRIELTSCIFAAMHTDDAFKEAATQAVMTYLALYSSPGLVAQAIDNLQQTEEIRAEREDIPHYVNITLPRPSGIKS